MHLEVVVLTLALSDPEEMPSSEVRLHGTGLCKRIMLTK